MPNDNLEWKVIKRHKQGKVKEKHDFHVTENGA
jgi:hypothetical protein